MSAFLGKIHFWLYDKILLHENLQEELFNFAETKGISTNQIKDKIYSKYGQPDFSPLEEVIDKGNIHGWLQNKITKVETALGDVVTTLLNEKKLTLEEMKEVFENNGVKAMKRQEDVNYSPEDLFALIFDHMIEGMPCDRVNQIIKNNEKEFSWKTTRCLHHENWEKVNGNIDNFYQLRDSWINGFLNPVGTCSYERTSDAISRIYKR